MAKKQIKYCIEVAPLTSIPLNRSPFFTYTFDKPISKGSLVSIPLFTRFLKGVVFDSYPFEERPDHLRSVKFKSITSIIQERFLTPEQIDLAFFISKTYFTSLGRCLVHFAPQIAKARASVNLPHPQSQHFKKIHPTDEQTLAINAIASSHKKPLYLFGPSSSGKTEVYIRSIQQKLCNGGQALVLVPELTLIPQEISRYGAIFGKENIAALHSHIAPGVFFETWDKIARGEIKVIIGTRQALFTPFNDLKMVVVDEEQDDAYKQWDMSPRYDGRIVAEELARIHKATLVFGSATPSIERFHKAQTKEYKLLTLSPLPMQPKYSIELVNLRFERYNKNFSPLSKQFVEEIALALKSKKQILIFINRQGSNAFSICENCKTILRCPSCDRALIYDANSGSYRCLHCTHTSSAFLNCSSCHGMNFKNIGTGTQKIEREILKKFPYTKVARIDQQTMKRKGSQETIYDQFLKGNINILIGTQMATKGWDIPNVGLVGIIDADSFFSFPDFKTDEIAFQHILQAVGRMARIGSRFEGKALIQTFYPENPTLQKIQEKDFVSFYKNIIEQRQDLSYPPFGQLIKIIYQDQDEKKVEKESEKMYKKLIDSTQDNPSIRVLPPQKPLLSKIRNRHRRQIIIKIRKGSLSPETISILQSAAKLWTIDINPINLI